MKTGSSDVPLPVEESVVDEDEVGVAVSEEGSDSRQELATTRPAPLPHPPRAVWVLFVTLTSLIPVFRHWVFGAMAPMAECGVFGWTLPPGLSFLTVWGGCAVPAASLWVLELLFWFQTGFMLTGIVPFWVILLLTFDEPQMSSHGVVSRYPVVDSVQRWSIAGAQTLTALLTFVGLGFVGLGVNMLVLVVAWLALSPCLLYIASGCQTWGVLRQGMAVYSHVTVMLGRTLAVVDNATDVGTALLLPPTHPLFATYWAFSVLSTLHGLATFAFPPSWVLAVKEAERSELDLRNASKENVQALQLWLFWKLLGRFGFDGPLVVMDIALVASGKFEFGQLDGNVILVGVIFKAIASISHGVSIGITSHRFYNLITQNPIARKTLLLPCLLSCILFDPEAPQQQHQRQPRTQSTTQPHPHPPQPPQPQSHPPQPHPPQPHTKPDPSDRSTPEKGEDGEGEVVEEEEEEEVVEKRKMKEAEVV